MLHDIGPRPPHFGFTGLYEPKHGADGELCLCQACSAARVAIKRRERRALAAFESLSPEEQERFLQRRDS